MSPSARDITPARSSAGQVCDRCRIKKTKCDGASPSCENCLKVGCPCTKSARLQRKTRIRGFQSSSEDAVQRLQAENESLRQSLQALREQSDSQTQAQRPSSHLPIGQVEVPEDADDGAKSQASGFSRSLPESTQPTLMIKHMGRVVPDGHGIERFVGSTTGTHFILSVQQAVNRHRLYTAPFPDECFRLHLIEPSLPRNECSWSQRPYDDFQYALNSMRRRQPYIDHMIHQFAQTWTTFCPVLVPSILIHRLLDLEKALQDIKQIPMISMATTIILVNNISADSDDDKGEVEVFYRLQRQLLPALMAVSDLESLQALSLLALYYLLSSQYVQMMNLNGLLVRIAESLGLHRHSRRFRFGAAEVELRKRVWWWVYMFDKMTSFLHGLPQLINDFDVDVDYPLDCDLEDLSDSGLVFPLPGESTQLQDFVHLIRLSRILSSMLSQLYTTTQRRMGPIKISSLEKDLRAWRQSIDGEHAPSYDAVDRFESVSSDMRSVWLPLAENITRFLIHRPGLTFDPETKPFEDSLRVCRDAACEIISLMAKHDHTLIDYTLASLSSLSFQCALVLVWSDCYQHSRASLLEVAGQSNTAIITKTIEMLNRRLSNQSWSKSPTLLAGITASINLLRSLVEGIILLDGLNPTSLPDSDHFDMATPILGSEYGLGQPTTPMLNMTDGIFLEQFNHLEFFDWSQAS